jgi:primosomal protein N' (replication factor Y)
MGLISVAVPVPFLDLLTYRVPDGMGAPAVGARVQVPVGSRMVTGCVVGHVAPGPTEGGPDEEPRELKDVVAVVDAEAFVPPAVVALCQWVAEYYVAGVGDALALAMPPGARARASGFRMRRPAKGRR